MALGSTQPLTEKSTRSISWGKSGRYVRLTTLPPSCAVVMKSGNLNFLEHSGPLQACDGTALPLPSLSWLSNSSILVSRQCESFRTLGQSFLAKYKACFCLSMGSLAASTFGYLELRKRGTFLPFHVWRRPSSLKPGAISAVHSGNIILLLLRENKPPHIINPYRTNVENRVSS